MAISVDCPVFHLLTPYRPFRLAKKSGVAQVVALMGKQKEDGKENYINNQTYDVMKQQKYQIKDNRPVY